MPRQNGTRYGDEAQSEKDKRKEIHKPSKLVFAQRTTPHPANNRRPPHGNMVVLSHSMANTSFPHKRTSKDSSNKHWQTKISTLRLGGQGPKDEEDAHYDRPSNSKLVGKVLLDVAGFLSVGVASRGNSL
ncbi:hypothetical protein Nepgr_026683 [Nepenthes gracilis]|uniref:Uncharacterized protein n=1 Tax=Nepenthes gracilis TaxID=150966 RepID=A0AAD3Y295_NEPGR|nr:hypothetical protein Nepgr_026683 [Nepenthes gracilis]